MICKIADLKVEVPAAGDLVSRCREYQICDTNEQHGADIAIEEGRFRPDAWKLLTGDAYIYMESGSHFYAQLLRHNGLMLHSSAVALDGKAYLFSGPCGMGKSTHTRLWQTVFGDDAKVFNDDKPALRYVDGRWMAFGTPWCGKDGININMKAPIAGICFLKRGTENRIRRLSNAEAIQKIIWQTTKNFRKAESLDLLLGHVDSLVRHVPVFELENLPVPEAAQLSYETMRKCAEEMGI